MAADPTEPPEPPTPVAVTEIDDAEADENEMTLGWAVLSAIVLSAVYGGIWFTNRR